jgi:hypothetical protein
MGWRGFFGQVLPHLNEQQGRVVAGEAAQPLRNKPRWPRRRDAGTP